MVLSQLVTSEPGEYHLLAGDIRDNGCQLAGFSWREIGRRSDEVEDLREAGGSFWRSSQVQSD
jgi:hypothetical protein